jgi:Adenosylmethionine decarboxylase.
MRLMGDRHMPVCLQGCYMTIHVTPEPDFSYVSFESNVPQASYKDMISRVLETFQPGKFVITVFANKVRTFLLL